jgi:V/A-type H+-transporting ATPase subunit I
MRLPEPIRMERVAVVAATDDFRTVLVATAEAGTVEPEFLPDVPAGPATEALQRALARNVSGNQPAVLAPELPDIAALEQTDRIGELAGEAELERVAGSAVTRGAVSAFAGWSPSAAVDVLAERLRPYGGTVVRLAFPRGAEPPTLVGSKGTASTFQPLVDIYATVPYADVNPSLFAGLAYVVMFGMMFGDAGHGALLFAGGFVLLTARSGWLAQYRRAAPFVIGAGVTSTLFGLAYGEAFGPTGLVPTLWLAPLAQPVTLLAAAIGVGAVLLAISYGLGTVNRWREGGPAQALIALSGVAGSALYLGLALVGAGWYRHADGLMLAGAVLVAIGLVFGFAGLYLESGGRTAGAIEAGVELFDAIVRIGANTISFARLAAFGLTHAALGAIVWSGTSTIGARGGTWWLLAALLFIAGNAVAFTLEALVAGVQALRLDYYELFSRIFISQGRPFRPWHVPTSTRKEA